MIQNGCTKQLLTLFFLLFTSLTFSQIIKGKVVADKTKQELAYASVYWQQTKQGVLTDDKGRFSIQESDYKKDSLVISYIGYQPKYIPMERVKSNKTIALQPLDVKIDAIVIGTLTAEEILEKAVKKRYQNHFVENSMQPGFIRSYFYYENDIAQVAEIAINQFTYIEDGDTTQINKAARSRAIIDSAAYRKINEIVNRKKDTVIVDPVIFRNFGNNFALLINNSDEENENKNKKLDDNVNYNGITRYGDRSAYDISFSVDRKEEKMFSGRFLIDEESFAFLALEFQSHNEENFDKMIPFAVRAILTFMGYNFEMDKLSGRVYYKYNNGKFDLDKAVSMFTMNVKKGGTWMNGTIKQETYYLPRRKSTISNPKEIKRINSQIVNYFSESFFEGLFHLPPNEQIKEAIAEIKERNRNFNGSIASDRHLRWLKRQN